MRAAEETDELYKDTLNGIREGPEYWVEVFERYQAYKEIADKTRAPGTSEPEIEASSERGQSSKSESQRRKAATDLFQKEAESAEPRSSLQGKSRSTRSLSDIMHG